jgi:hypothetical protein
VAEALAAVVAPGAEIPLALAVLLAMGLLLVSVAPRALVVPVVAA